MIDAQRFIRDVLGDVAPAVEIAVIDSVSVVPGRKKPVEVLENLTAVLLDVTVQPLLWRTTVRLMTPYLGQGYGHIALPVPGDEVIVLFPGGNPNAGVAQWGTFNGRNKVPVGAVEKLILFEGRDGDNLRVHLRGAASIEIDLDQDLTIHGSEVRTVDGSRSVTIRKNETEAIGGNRTLEVGGNETRTVGGNSTEVIGGSATRTVMGPESDSCLGRLTVVGVPATTPVPVADAWIIVVAGPVMLSCVSSFSMSVDGTPVMTATAELVNFLVQVDGDRT